MQHNYIQLNQTMLNNIQYNNIQHNPTQNSGRFSQILGIYAEHHYAKCHGTMTYYQILQRQEGLS
jgi:hypothetical protein